MYDLGPSRKFCESIGLIWLGDAYAQKAMEDAEVFGFSQQQFDIAMENHLHQVKFLFTPKNYDVLTRIKLACHFLFNNKY